MPDLETPPLLGLQCRERGGHSSVCLFPGQHGRNSSHQVLPAGLARRFSKCSGRELPFFYTHLKNKEPETLSAGVTPPRSAGVRARS